VELRSYIQGQFGYSSRSHTCCLTGKKRLTRTSRLSSVTAASDTITSFRSIPGCCSYSTSARLLSNIWPWQGRTRLDMKWGTSLRSSPARLLNVTQAAARKASGHACCACCACCLCKLHQVHVRCVARLDLSSFRVVIRRRSQK
jgi:hypothetical protein